MNQQKLSMLIVFFVDKINFTYFRLQNSIDRLLNVGFKDVGLGQLFVPVGGQPDPGQWPLLGQHKVRVKHRLAAKILKNVGINIYKLCAENKMELKWPSKG